MRVAADQRGIEHRGRENVLCILRQQREILRDILTPLGLQRLTEKQDLALVMFTQAGECQQGQRFAGTILTEHSKKVAAADSHLQIPHQRAAGNGDRQVIAGKCRIGSRAHKGRLAAPPSKSTFWKTILSGGFRVPSGRR